MLKLSDPCQTFYYETNKWYAWLSDCEMLNSSII